MFAFLLRFVIMLLVPDLEYKTKTVKNRYDTDKMSMINSYQIYVNNVEGATKDWLRPKQRIADPG